MMYDDDLLRRARLCLGLVPDHYRERYGRLFRYAFEGADRCIATSGAGAALVRVACEADRLEGIVESRPGKVALPIVSWLGEPVARGALFDWLENSPANSEALGVARGVVFDRRLVRDWLAPFLGLPIEMIRVSGPAENQRTIRIDGDGWIVIVCGRLEEPADLNPFYAECK